MQLSPATANPLTLTGEPNSGSRFEQWEDRSDSNIHVCVRDTLLCQEESWPKYLGWQKCVAKWIGGQLAKMSPEKITAARAHGRKSWSGAWRFVLTNPYRPGVLADAWQAGRDEARTERVNCHDPQVSEVQEMRKAKQFLYA